MITAHAVIDKFKRAYQAEIPLLTNLNTEIIRVIQAESVTMFETYCCAIHTTLRAKAENALESRVDAEVNHELYVWEVQRCLRR